MTRACSVEECGSPVRCQGLCNAHYLRLRKHGDTSVVIKRSTPRGQPLRFLESVPLKGLGCLTWPFGRDARGIAKINHCGSMKNAARVMCEHAYGSPPQDNAEAAHSCGKAHEACIAPWHLRWATPTENQADRLLHGTDGRGERNASARLSESDVAEIRRLTKSSKHKEIAARFGVTRQTVGDIANNRRWGWM
jgi:hypothetical protein